MAKSAWPVRKIEVVEAVERLTGKAPSGGPAARRRGRAADRAGARVVLDHRGRAGPQVHRRSVQAVERGLVRADARAAAGQRRARLTSTVTIDIDTTDVEVYGSKKRGVAYNHAGQRWRTPASSDVGGDRDHAGRRPAATTIPAPARRSCCAGRWPPCRRGCGCGRV